MVLQDVSTLVLNMASQDVQQNKEEESKDCDWLDEQFLGYVSKCKDMIQELYHLNGNRPELEPFFKDLYSEEISSSIEDLIEQSEDEGSNILKEVLSQVEDEIQAFFI
nr:uncharacterized protein LOC121125623 [Lepeophtheirus salmonis]